MKFALVSVVGVLVAAGVLARGAAAESSSAKTQAAGAAAESVVVPPPPATKVEPVTDTLHGVAVTDPYRWLEGDDSDPAHMGKVTPEVAAWTDAQDAYTRSILDHLPGRKALEDRLRPLMEIGSVSPPEIRGDRYFFEKREGAQNQAVVYFRDGYRGASKALLDPAKLDPSGLTPVTWFSPSQDGKLVAYGTYKAGDENTALHLLDLATGETLPLAIPNRVEPPDWLPDGSGFVYRNLRDPKDPYSGQVMFHEMGKDPSSDALLFRQFTKEENAKLATTWGPGASLSRDGKWLILTYYTSTRTNDLWVADFARYRATGRLEKIPVTVGGDGLASATEVGGTLFISTTQGAPGRRRKRRRSARPASSR